MSTCSVFRSSSGLTIIELMVVMVLSLLLMAAVYISSQLHSRTTEEQHRVMTLQQDLRAVMDVIEHDILNSGCDPRMVNRSNLPAFGITVADPSTLGFTSDLDRDGVLNQDAERITYGFSQDATSLTRCVGDPTSPENCTVLAGNATNLQFTYLDGNNVQTATRSEIRSIEVLIEMRGRSGGFEYLRHLTRRIQCRNAGL